MPRDAKSIELANKKAAYIGELLKDEPKLSLLAVRKKIQEKFEASLNFKRSRAEFIAAGGKVRAKHSSKRRRKNVLAASEALPKRGPGRPPKNAKQDRGPGRRKADRSAVETTAALRKFGQHLVVISAEGSPLIRTFANKGEASAFVQSQLKVGTPLTEIAAYSRDSLSINLDV
ncbi:MAG: hypothetical protein IT462_11605 [Planctomycetes bacterium]|nr:hypothetical protein [Planctomycetota bacterium]